MLHILTIEEHNKNSPQTKIQESIVHTGQHYDDNMSGSFFRSLGIPKPIANLEVPGGKHGLATGHMLTKLEALFEESLPNAVLVYGDTNSTLAGALAAAKIHIPVIHVEAGLRSFNKRMPEEINRILTDHVSQLLFCPTDIAAEHLKNEGLTQNVHIVGDVMYDVALRQSSNASPLDEKEPFILATLHRAENTDDPKRLQAIFNGMASANKKVLLPLHPRTKQKISDFSINVSDSIRLLAPIPYEKMIWGLQNCEFVMTDSGGLQKEAYFFKKRCITLRDETEWTELISNRVNVLVGASEPAIQKAIDWASEDGVFKPNIYGNGNACGQIVTKLVSYFY